ncbi:crotonase/enoyl-CoA hydratase family protein [Noviherbaspirillum galbum]|uniref:Crotonase/enoyl-CoA hydratase family protein n=1 Tax=Noviherbaspirillum galbum TaxID=2709383 RepID=A0A6B3SPB0_9BURK|nr:crotonase/enoyl-CoA hydratase family protein [Noviherbaspirillum galbum]NEX62583.1 crotonase/enoyl-CoA hydratase family protein [Noviherbaspirillum galbum]
MNAFTDIKHLGNVRHPIGKPYRQLAVEYDRETRSVWTYLQPQGTPCFNLGLLGELIDNHRTLAANGGKVLCNGNLEPVDYIIGGSRTPHVFNYGGDLALFVLLIKSRDREALLHYAKQCIDCLHGRLLSYETNAITISLVQGEALGGGFESALSSHVIVAEQSSRMGFPEILFNLFPGMGAYSLVSRRIGARAAEEMISSGKIYSATELHEMGLVDVLAADGQGENAVYDFIRKNERRRNGLRAMYECRRHTTPISYDELMGITEAWVDAALRLDDRDLKMMGRLVRSQQKQLALRKAGHVAEPGGEAVEDALVLAE